MSESCCHISSYGHRMKLEYTKMDTRSFPHEEKMVTADNVWHQSSSLSVLVYAAVSPRHTRVFGVQTLVSLPLLVEALLIDYARKERIKIASRASGCQGTK
ncbi:hypothetical protein LSAT2_002123 [Lamellibrachia satsuma]|nr:hypothetical protein LSAT2_002123 [Lamellibrachia satsuma]